MSFPVDRLRRDTPGCKDVIHLNNAGASLMPGPVSRAVRAHLDREERSGGYEAETDAADDILAVYADCARLVGAEARQIAVVENATAAMAQAVSAFDPSPGDVIVTTRDDYISHQLLFLSLAKRRGVRVERAAELPEGGVDPASVRGLIRAHRPVFVALSWIPTNSGLVQDAAGVGTVCAEEGTAYLLDACQAVGQMPIPVDELHCDFLAATARKFLRGPRGIGFLYVSERMLSRGAFPLYLDMRGGRWLTPDTFALAEDARRFENWEQPWALVLGMGAAARYAVDDVGVSAGGRRAAALAERLRTALDALDGVTVLDRGRTRCAIVTAAVANRAGASLVRALRDRGINTSAIEREFAVIDMDAKGARTGLRLSPHYFNTEDEIDTVAAALGDLAGSAAR